jgi:DNA-binding MarR family transcriptional regulator
LGENTLGALARALTDELGVRILSPEFEILLSLYDHGDFSAGELQLRSTASSTAFYLRLKLLARAGAIRLDKGTADRRVSRYTLAPETRRILDEAFGALDDWAGARAAAPEGGKSFDWLLARVSNLLDLTLLSPEFSVIMNIYDCEPIMTSELFYRTRLANSKFYAVLTLLAARRTIAVRIDRSDRRRRLYCLPRGVRKQLDQLLRDFRVIRPQPELA